MLLLSVLSPQHHRKIFTPAANHIAIVNSCGVRATTGVTSENVAFNGASCNDTGLTPASGDIAILYVFYVTAPTSPSCAATDSASNTWTTTATGPSANKELICMSTLTHSANATETVSWTGSSAVVIFTLELSGAQNALDGSSCSGTAVNNVCFVTIVSSSSWTLPSYTSSNANDIAIGFDGGAGTSVTWSGVSPWTLLNTWSSTSAATGSLEYQIVTATGAYAPKVNLSGSQPGAGATLLVKSQ